MAKNKEKEKNPIKELEGPDQEAMSSRPKALVFISHDARDADLAEAFGNLLTDSSGGFLKSFRSSDRKGTTGIEFGSEWYTAIMARLNEATDVVALLTRHSVDRPWILYEAGVAKGKLDTTVFGVALGIPMDQAINGPFAQFQNCADDEDSLTKLVLQLIKRYPDADPREEAVRRQVQAFRSNIAGLRKSGSKAATGAPHGAVDEPAVAKLFEEIKVMFSSLPDRLETKVEETLANRPERRHRRLHPMMMEEVLFHPEIQEMPGGIESAWLMSIGMFRDDIPWLYEPGMEVYRTLCAKDADRINDARRRFVDVLRFVRNSRMFSKSMHEVEGLRHLPEMLEHFLDRAVDRSGGKRRHRSQEEKK